MNNIIYLKVYILNTLYYMIQCHVLISIVLNKQRLYVMKLSSVNFNGGFQIRSQFTYLNENEFIRIEY